MMMLLTPLGLAKKAGQKRLGKKGWANDAGSHRQSSRPCGIAGMTEISVRLEICPRVWRQCLEKR